jgi:hypothetical protein
MDKAWHSYMNVHCICCCTVLAVLLKFEAFFKEFFPNFVTSDGLLEEGEEEGVERAWASFTV